MIEILPGYPDNILAITASNNVTGDDYESVIIPAIEAKVKSHGKIRMLYNLGPEFTGFRRGRHVGRRDHGPQALHGLRAGFAASER